MILQLKVTSTLFLISCWSLLYFLIDYFLNFPQLLNRKSNDTKNRFISIIHGSISFWFCVYLIYNYPNLLKKERFSQTIVLIMLSLSYFIYDLLACFYYELIDNSLILHHGICIFGLTYSLFTENGSSFIVMGLAVSEISNFPMHARIILRNFNLKFTRSYEISENIYLGLYIIFRGILSPILLLIPSFFSKNTSFFIKIVILALHLQSFYFIWQMIGIIQLKFIRISEKGSKSIKYHWYTERQDQLSKLSFYKSLETPKTF